MLRFSLVRLRDRPAVRSPRRGATIIASRGWAPPIAVRGCGCVCNGFVCHGLCLSLSALLRLRGEVVDSRLAHAIMRATRPTVKVSRTRRQVPPSSSLAQDGWFSAIKHRFESGRGYHLSPASPCAVCRGGVRLSRNGVACRRDVRAASAAPGGVPGMVSWQRVRVVAGRSARRGGARAGRQASDMPSRRPVSLPRRRAAGRGAALSHRRRGGGRACSRCCGRALPPL